MKVLRHVCLVALLTTVLAGCGRGSGGSSIPTAAGPKVEKTDLQGISGFEGVRKSGK